MMMKNIFTLSLWIATSLSASSFILSPRSPPFTQLSESKAGELLWKVEKVEHIHDWTGIKETYPNPLSLKPHVPSSWFVGLNDAVAAKVQINALETAIDDTCILKEDDNDVDEWEDCEVVDRGLSAEAFILAGPRSEIAFNPKDCKAAIVTCGGLCPGLNSVIQQVVMCLRRQYGVTQTYGVKAGYRGFSHPETWIQLDEDNVKNLHHKGGSILGSSRGGHDTEAIVDSLVEQGVNLLFVVGGDG